MAVPWRVSAEAGASMLREEEEKGSRSCQGEERHPSPWTEAVAVRVDAEPLVPAYTVLCSAVHSSSATASRLQAVLWICGVLGERADRDGSCHGGIIVLGRAPKVRAPPGFIGASIPVWIRMSREPHEKNCGSSPRVRGTGSTGRQLRRDRRFIPGCAGNS